MILLAFEHLQTQQQIVFLVSEAEHLQYKLQGRLEKLFSSIAVKYSDACCLATNSQQPNDYYSHLRSVQTAYVVESLTNFG